MEIDTENQQQVHVKIIVIKQKYRPRKSTRGYCKTFLNRLQRTVDSRITFFSIKYTNDLSDDLSGLVIDSKDRQLITYIFRTKCELNK